MAPVSFQPLKSLPEHIPCVAKWCSDTWGGSSGLNIKDYEAWLHRRLMPDEFGGFWIALSGNTPVGCVQLTTWHLTEKPTPIPALANLYVVPEHRKQGLGQKLCAHVEKAAKAQHLNTLYLIADTGIESYYQKQGWQKSGQDGDKNVFCKPLI